MRTRGAAALLLLLLSTIQISRTEDLYLEGEEDASNEFLEVKDNESGLGGHLRRLKRQWFNFFDPFSSSSTTTESPDDEVATEDTDDVDALSLELKPPGIMWGKESQRKDLDHFGSGFPEKVEPQDHKEKTLRVTFVVMEPYQHEYSNRDSPQFRNFSRTIADAVDQLYEPLGTRRTSLVRIQSRVSDEFSCKVTLDILTTGYEDINRLIDILRDHIKNLRELASGTRRVTVSDADFSANIIDPDTPVGPCGDDEMECDIDRCLPATSRCNGVRECVDGTDENNCVSHPDDTTPNPTTDSGYYNPYNPQCSNPIPCQDSSTTYCLVQRCDGYNDCPNAEDEMDCEHQPYPPQSPEPERTPSPATETPALPCDSPIRCQLSDAKYCPSQHCDGNYDCPYHDDEEDCPFDSDQDQSISVNTTPSPSVDISGQAPACPFPVHCQDSNVTYCPPQRCNSIYDCPNQDDEFDCNDVDSNQYPQPGPYGPQNPSYPVTDAPSLPCDYPEQCQGSDVKYCPNQRCDGVADCPNQDDEYDCQRPDDEDQRRGPDDEDQRRGDQDRESISCPTGSFQCDKTRCLMDTQRCDGVPDCYDRTDEANCKPIGSDDFRCNNGQSIEASRHCDRVSDCPSGEDEIDCDCYSNEFQCERDRICIESRKKCDGYPDCSDGSDERGCGGHHVCKGSGRFRCGDGSCISVRLRCDGYRDCPKDGSDEVHCPCSSDEWQCDHGNCIKRTKRCDGRIDCPTDRSDERNCLDNEEQFLCANRVQSIPISQRCDRYYDCDDYSDEKNCPCGVGDYICNNGFCIPARKRCDGTHDCQDGSDEHNCKNGSESESECMHMFKCTSGECVPPEAQCNGTAECRDGSDESDCHCKRDEYRCQDTDMCISLDKRCDNHFDCDIGDDEFNCENTCEEGQISCASDNTYVQTCAKQCDGKQECLNNEDEQNCPTSPDCSHFCDGRCLESGRICDGTADCSDASDEDDCALCNGPDDFRCDNGECINRNLQCNSIPECSDSSDEFNCKNITTPGPPGDCYDQFQCRDGNCVNKDFFCDGHTDCPDNSDEENCPWYMGRPSRSPIPPEPCLEAEFTCYDGRCITHARRCDNVYDCLDFSDEQNCHTSACKEGEFQCRSGQCIPESGVCDNYPQCDDGSDETNCALPPTTRPSYVQPYPPVTTHRPTVPDVWTPAPYPPYNPPPQASSGCGFSKWQCENGVCIDESRRCDGRIDCSDTSDEFNCPLGSPVALKLKTYPDQQNVSYFGDVVFDCRDEGPQRARVTWIRGDGKRMNPNFKITGKGRLELNNVTTADSGTYICQAVEFQYAPGSQKTVYLQVDKQITSTRQRSPACGPQEATCSNLKCIPKSAICDGKQDCGDGSDEHSCGSSMANSCQPNQFRCANNRCILKTWVCDSENDCDDGSDEDPQQCGSLNSTEGCSPVEYACKSGNQCIPKSYHCDHLSDCMDGSDELTCAPVYVVKPPHPSNVRIYVGDVLKLSCKATGVPVPLISWRLNWGHVPPQCTSTSDNGEGRLVCPNMQREHSGAYSCEAINNKGATFAIPDSIVIVEHDADVCPIGKFNSEAHDSSECIECFCFGKSKQCKSAELFVYDMAESLGQGGTRLVGVKLDSQGPQIDSQSITNEYYYQPGRNGASVTKLSYGSRSRSYAHPYLTVPASYTGKQLTSYGGEIKYSLSSQSAYPSPRYDNYMPDIIIMGKYETLVYTQSGDKSTIQVKLVPGNWQKYSSGRPELASRVDIMMALDNVENILLRAELNGAGVNITDFLMQSAKNIDQGLGPANLVEECTCPEGYTGLSCENCASGYERDSSGPLVGHCRPQRRQCPPSTFGDPANGYACSPCPCPLTTPSNQFASTCYLGPSGVVCDCQLGYEGNNCEYCAEGYEGNPNTLGDSCRKVHRSPCDPTGTNQILPLERCECKDNVQGQYCDQCKNGFYFLSPDFTHGCAACFCSGVSQNCGSSSLRRKTTHAVFNSESSVSQLSVYSSTSSRSGYNAPTMADVIPNLENGAARAYINSRADDVYYWSLPASFAGDKVTSYGGNLYYTLDNVPYNYSPGSGAADVQLISENSLTFHHVADVRPSSSGILNVTVPFFETKWMRVDGKEVPREQFLLALADVKTILVKAKYDRGDELASLIGASIETAEPGGTGPAALHVEQCICPKEYIGTSCEDCAPGYKRYPHGLYLEKCGPCECNDHSNMCDPDTGVCMNCRDNTAGDFCEECLPGYQKDAYNNCVRAGSQTTCECDSRGITVPCEEVGYCQCKQNVEGSSCNHCRPGTFGLDSENPAGCLACYCSGVSSECHETSNFKRIPLAAPIFGDNYGGYSITNLNGNNVVASNFVPMPDYSELMYTFPFPPNEELFWSLPVFPGNRVLSYGGILQFDQKFEDHSPGAIPETHKHVILIGDDTSVYWNSPAPIETGEKLQVPLREDEWYLLNSATPASRNDFMNVLKSLRRVLVKATLTREMLSTSIADVSMDTATTISGSEYPSVKGIEVCMCPPGYTGTSCETCTSGFYKDERGMCRECSCNGHECQLGSDNQVVCQCRPPYTGPTCTTYGLSMELQPTLEEDPEDGPQFKKVTLTCKYAAHEPLTIRFYSEGSEVGVPKLYNESVFDKEGWRGEHVWHTVWDTRTDTIYECHTVTKKGATMGVLTASMPEPGESIQRPNSTLPPIVSPTIVVTISQPIVIKEIGGSVTFTCQARSRMVNGNLPVRWSKAGGYLPRGRAIVDENSGTLVIMQLQKTDTGKYICETSDGQSTNQAVATLTVGDNPRRSPEVSIEPAVNEYNEGDRIELVCRVTGNPEPTISWRRADSRKPLPNSATIYGGRLIIEEALEEDSGDYRCTASNTEGVSDRIALIMVRPRPYNPPRDRLTVSTNSPVVNEGNSTSVTCTGTPGIPAGTIQWVRQDGTDLHYNVRSDNGVLYVENAKPENQGVYMCQTLYNRVNPVAISLTVIPMVSPPEDSPNITVSVDTLRIPTGGSGSVDCSPSGYPLPVVKWTKHDGRFGPGTSQRGNTLMITNAQNDDQGFYECEGLINNEPRSNIYVYVEIERREAPQVRIYPEDPRPVTIGDSYELRCHVTGGVPDPVVTWESSRPMTANAHILPDNILRFENIDVNDEGAYTCTASNSAGKANATSIVKVQASPVITMTPSNQLSAQLGDSINFVCRATGVPLPNVSIKSENGRELVPPSPGSATLHIDSASERDSGSYHCLATSPAGSLDEPFIIDLNRGDLGFEPDGTEQPDYDPGFNTVYEPGNNNVGGPLEPPANQIILTEGKENVLRCDSEGYDTNWGRTDRQPLQRSVRPYGDQLIFTDTSKSDAGEYECILYDLRTREPVNAITYRVDVMSLPKVTIQPPTQTVHPGESTSVDCIVDGDQIQDVTWQLSRQSSRIEVQNSRLIFHQIEVDDAGDYVCTARNPLAEVNGTAKVIVTDDTRVPKKSQNTDQYALINSNVHLNCTTRQRHTTTKWTKDGRPLLHSRKTSTKSDGSLFIKSAKKSDSGRYACIITDAYGQQMTKHIILHVSGPPMSSALVSIDQPRRQYRVGENVEVTCRKASRDTTATWEKYGTREFVETREYNEGVVLVILGVEESDAGVYRCIGRDRYGYSSYEDFDLNVQPSQQPPSYPMSNQNVHVAHVGQTVDMPCRHNLEPPVYIEWRKEYLNLPPYVRQNEPILTLRNITEADAGTYVCRITNQRAAVEARSTLKVTGVVPRFDGNSWLAVPNIKDAYRQFDIEVSFKPSTADGTILYNNQRPDGSGDYLALQLVNGIPVFTLETGSSVPVVVEGDRPLQLNAWHTVRLSRVNSKVSMFVDETGPFVSELREPWEVLDLSDPLYVGAVPDYVLLPPNLNTTYGFVGCISMLVLSKKDVNLIPDSVDSRNVGECDTCSPNLCINEGVCQEARNERGYICLCAPGFAGLNCNRTGEACRPGICGPGKCSDTADGYSCACPLTYTGKNCDMKQHIEYPAFTGSAYLAIKVPTTSRVLRVAMNVKATSPVSDGIIMYWAESARGTGGFTSLTVHNGRLEFTYDLGDGYPVVIVANRTLQPNEWTDVRIAKVGSAISLTVNQVHTYTGRLSSFNTELTLDTPMFVGGVDDSIVLNSNLGVSEGFNGCIKDLSVFNDPVNIINSSIQSANIKECSTYKDDRGDIPEMESVCSQCRNGGQCAPDSSVCTCPAGYYGTYCENRASDNMARLPRSPCADAPCRNGGTCKMDMNSRMKYSCDCPLGYGGANCQMILELRNSVAFNGNGYIELPASLLSYENLETDPAVIALAMHSNSDGVLFYQRQALLPAGYGDYIMIRVVKGVVVLEWDMGGGAQTLFINEVYVADGERHSIIVKILPEGEVYLSVDSFARTAATDSLQKTMNADSNIYVGGMPETLNVNRYPGLSGCIEQVELMNSARGLYLGEVAVAARNTQLCKEH